MTLVLTPYFTFHPTMPEFHIILKPLDGIGRNAFTPLEDSHLKDKNPKVLKNTRVIGIFDGNEVRTYPVPRLYRMKLQTAQSGIKRLLRHNDRLSTWRLCTVAKSTDAHSSTNHFLFIAKLFAQLKGLCYFAGIYRLDNTLSFRYMSPHLLKSVGTFCRITDETIYSCFPPAFKPF
jgi:hypothetical protein